MKSYIEGLAELLRVDNTSLYYYGNMILKVLILFLLAKLVIVILDRLVMKVFKLYPRFRADEKKASTLTGIIKSVIKYTVYIIMGISILETLNIPTQPLLATAGLGGIAIGFGAQSLVKDVFSGFFILFEDQYGVGDYVTISGLTGTVEDIGLRTTRIRAFNGDLHIIPNGEVKTVTNVSRGNSMAIVDMGVAYESDQEKAMRIMATTAFKYYTDNQHKVAEKPEVLGIIKLGESDVAIRVIAKTMPLMHWSVERDLRLLILEAFKQAGIEIPYPKRILVDKK